MYVAKEDFILKISPGMTVLHLGCVGFTDLDGEERVRSAKQSLHWKLSQCADVVGVDRSGHVVEELRRFAIFDNVVCGDVERLDDLAIDQKFDIVVAGDIIEHLSNPGRMLDGIQRFCTVDTRIVITTPNAFGAPNFLRHSAGKFREGAEHVMSFNEQNLTTLLRRHGYTVSELHTCFQPRSADGHNHLAFRVGTSLLGMFPRFGGTLLVVAKPSDAQEHESPCACSHTDVVHV
jgi:SAM-dependent methyltransferase